MPICGQSIRDGFKPPPQIDFEQKKSLSEFQSSANNFNKKKTKNPLDPQRLKTKTNNNKYVVDEIY